MRLPFHLTFIVLFAFLLAACGSDSAAPATAIPSIVPTLTPDPCIEPGLSAEVGKVQTLMREFDDYSALASNTPQAQLVVVIPEMQRVLRDAEDQSVPACLVDLKRFQIEHMTVVVQTLLTFISSSDVNVVNAGIAQARELHTRYDVEMARLLGITLIVATPSAPEPAATP